MRHNGITPAYPANETSHGPRAVILIASGFDEQSVALMVTQLRRSGQSVFMVSATAGLVRGEHGLAIRPDHSLESLPSMEDIQVVGVPGGRRSALTLLADPRVHQLFDQVLARDGRLSVLGDAERAFVEAGQLDLLGNEKCWLQGDEGLEALTFRVLDYLATWHPVKE